MTGLEHALCFPALNLPWPIKSFPNISYCSVQHLTMQGELLQIYHPLLLILSYPLPLDCPARQTWHQHPHLHSLLSCSTGTHTEQSPAPVSKHQPSNAPDTFSFGDGGAKKNLLKFARKIRLLPPRSFFSPHSFKCQTPTQFLWKFEQLVRSVWKQNKPQHVSPFGELSRRQHAFQGGDDSVFSSLGLGCRPKNSKHFFVHLCWIRAYF